MLNDTLKRRVLLSGAAAALLFMALIILFGVSESEFRWGF